MVLLAAVAAAARPPPRLHVIVCGRCPSLVELPAGSLAVEPLPLLSSGVHLNTTKDTEVWDITREEHFSDGASCRPAPGELRARKSRRAAYRKRRKPSPSQPGEGRLHLLSVEISMKTHIDIVSGAGHCCWAAAAVAGPCRASLLRSASLSLALITRPSQFSSRRMRDPAFVDRKPLHILCWSLFTSSTTTCWCRQGHLSFASASSGEEPLEGPRLRLDA